MVMAQDGVLCDPNLAADQFGCGCDLLMREIEHLLVFKFKGRRKIDGQVVAEPVLSERRAVPIGDLSARSRNIEDVSAGKLLCLKCRDNVFVDRGGRRFGRCGRRGSGRALRVELRQRDCCHAEQSQAPPVHFGERFLATFRMTSVSAAAKTDEYLPPACAQSLPLTRSLPLLLCAVDSPNQIFAGAKSSGSDSHPGNRRECFRRSVSSSAIDDRCWQIDALRPGSAEAMSTPLNSRAAATAGPGRAGKSPRALSPAR